MRCLSRYTLNIDFLQFSSLGHQFCPSNSESVHLSASLSNFGLFHVSLYVCLSVELFVFLSAYMPSCQPVSFLSINLPFYWRLFPSVSPSITVELRYKKSLIHFKILCSSCREQQIKAQSTNHANIQSINLSKHARHTYWPILALLGLNLPFHSSLTFAFLFQINAFIYCSVSSNLHQFCNI